MTINPGTPLAAIEPVLEMVDLVQVMTVNPGFGGQEFIQGQLPRIERLRRMIDGQGLQVAIGVDGGINPVTAPLVVAAGATVLVAGSSIYGGAVAENVAALRASVA